MYGEANCKFHGLLFASSQGILTGAVNSSTFQINFIRNYKVYPHFVWSLPNIYSVFSCSFFRRQTFFKLPNFNNCKLNFIFNQERKGKANNLRISKCWAKLIDKRNSLTTNLINQSIQSNSKIINLLWYRQKCVFKVKWKSVSFLTAFTQVKLEPEKFNE